MLKRGRDTSTIVDGERERLILAVNLIASKDY